MGMLDDVKAKKKQKAADNWMKMADSAKTTEKQIEYYSKSLDIDPYNAEAWFKKGKALENLGKHDKAKKCFDLAVEIDPDYQGFIGRKYESTAAHEVYNESQPVGTPVSMSLEEDVELSSSADMIEEDTGEYSFTPPAGDESAFGDMLMEREDNGSPMSVVEDTEENIFSSGYESSSSIPVPEVISDEKPAETRSKFHDDIPVFAAVSNGIEKEHVAEEDTFSSPVPEKSYPSDEPEMVAAESVKAPIKEQEPEIAVPVKQPDFSSGVSSQKETVEKPISKPAVSQETITRPAVTNTPGDGPVDVRIPLSEAIKFWAIGIIAMLIVSVISSFIQG